MSTTRGASDVLWSVVIDLRGYQPLVDRLPERQAIYQSYVADNYGYPIEVTISPVFDGSTPHRGVIERSYRVQVTVKATYSWREEIDRQPGTDSTLALLEILDRVGDRLDRAPGIRETALGGEGSPDPMFMDDGRLAVVGDWRLGGWYDDPSPWLIDRGYANVD
jgi:hypothetical protein